MNHSTRLQNVEYPNNLCLNAFLNFQNKIENKFFKKEEINTPKHPYEIFLEEQFQSNFIENKNEEKKGEEKKGEEKKEEEKKGEEKKGEDKKGEDKKEEEKKGEKEDEEEKKGEKEDEEKMDIEKDEEIEDKKEKEKKREEIKNEKNIKNKRLIVKIKNKKRITKDMLKNPQSINALGDQLQMAANAAYDIFKKKEFLSIIKKKIDESSEEDLNKQNKSILNDYRNNIFYINNILKDNNI